MHQTTPQDFYLVFKVMSEMFDNKLSTEAVEIYYRILSKYPVEELREAATQILCTYKYNCMPKPAEFIEAITESRRKKYLEGQDNIKQLYQEPSEEDLKKIRDLVQGVVSKFI